MDPSWLIQLYQEAGIEKDHAVRAANQTLTRLLSREYKPSEPSGNKSSLTTFFVRDPMVSVARITGRNETQLPFCDQETKQLNPVAFTRVLTDVGLDPVVAMAYARVIVEAYTPADVFLPLWTALGQSADFDLDVLNRLDWSPIRRAQETKSQVVSPVPQFQVSMNEPELTTPGTLVQGARRAPRAKPKK